jgi:hypothetical protein
MLTRVLGTNKPFDDDMNAMAKHGEPNALEIEPEALTSPVAIALVAALNAELLARYPEPGATHFRLDPGEVAPGTGVFLVVRWSGRPVGCGALRCLRDPVLMRELGPRVGEVKRMYVAPERSRSTAARNSLRSRRTANTGCHPGRASAWQRRCKSSALCL